MCYSRNQILLCLWHTRKAWIDNATQNIKVNYLRAEILAAYADLRYGNEILQGELAVKAAKEKFKFLKARYPHTKVFFFSIFKRPRFQRLRCRSRDIETFHMPIMTRMQLLRATMQT